jgi:hypothetical protein
MVKVQKFRASTGGRSAAEGWRPRAFAIIFWRSVVRRLGLWLRVSSATEV